MPDLANVALWVSEERLKSFLAIHQSVSPKDLTPYVIQAQLLVLQSYLGSTFFNQLNNQIVTNTVTAANRKILDDYIGPCLMNWAMYDALPLLTYKVYQKSILKPGSESSQNIGLDELKFLRQETRDVAESYLKHLQIYLKNNLTLYPAYEQYLLSDGLAPNKKSPYFSGIQTSSKRYKKRQSSMDICDDCD